MREDDDEIEADDDMDPRTPWATVIIIAGLVIVGLIIVCVTWN